MPDSAEIIVLTKICNSCSEEKRLNDFPIEKRVRDGRAATCRACWSISRKKWHDRNPEYQTKWRKEMNPESARKSMKKKKEKEKVLRQQKRIENGLPLLEARMTKDGRMCSGCRERLSLSVFSPDKSYCDGTSPYCKPCAARRTRDSFKKNPKVVPRELRKKYYLKRSYGITLEVYQQMLTEQDGKCAICAKHVFGEDSNSCVDHCHITKQIRGILCRKCNTGIGQFQDREDLLLEAIKYLSKYREN